MLFRIITLNGHEAVTAPSNAVTIIGNVPAKFDCIGAIVKIQPSNVTQASPENDTASKGLPSGSVTVIGQITKGRAGN